MAAAMMQQGRQLRATAMLVVVLLVTLVSLAGGSLRRTQYPARAGARPTAR